MIPPFSLYLYLHIICPHFSGYVLLAFIAPFGGCFSVVVVVGFVT
jgi:hypothetical protein